MEQKFRIDLNLIRDGMVKQSQPLIIHYTEAQKKKYGENIEQKIFDMFVNNIISLYGQENSSSFLVRKEK